MLDFVGSSARDPPAYRSIAPNVPQSEVLLEWKDILERTSDEEGSLMLDSRRKARELNVIDCVQVNGERFDKPPEGWGISAGPFVLRGGKNTFRVVIELDEDWMVTEQSTSGGAVYGVGRYEIHYEVSLYGMKVGVGTVTKDREFKIRKSS